MKKFVTVKPFGKYKGELLISKLASQSQRRLTQDGRPGVRSLLEIYIRGTNLLRIVVGRH